MLLSYERSLAIAHDYRTVGALPYKTRFTLLTDIQDFAHEAIEYHSRIFPISNSPYAGLPNPSVDESWRNLLANMSIRVSKAELEHHNQSSVQFLEGDYLAWMAVFHELHCVVGHHRPA